MCCFKIQKLDIWTLLLILNTMCGQGQIALVDLMKMAIGE